ncbi:hypothetical protein [Sphingomonas faeni]|uniref:hypothetical protein n=1 Tax=Sphingomonas faeni TaxID=185950 RepID=UPI00335FF494
MTTDREALAALLATLTVLSATPAAAQSAQTSQTGQAEQTPQPAPVRGLEVLGTPQTTSIPVPAAPKIVLPSTPPRGRTRTTPTPAAKMAAKPGSQTPTTRDERSATRPADNAPSRPRPSSGDTTATAAPRDEPTTPAPAPVATPDPKSAPTPAPTMPPATIDTAPSVAPSSTPTSAPTQDSTLAAPETGRAMPLWLSLAVVVVVLAGLWFLRRRKPASRAARAEPEIVAEPIPEPAVTTPDPVATAIAPAIMAPVVPAVAAPTAPKFLEPRGKSPPVPPAAPRARLACELRPLRAGLNLLSATVECELVVTNSGTAPAEAIRAGLTLLTAHTGQDTDLAAFNVAPVVRPLAAPFVLAPGETRTLRTVAAVAREAIRTMTAANRPMFVPVVAANLRYVTAGEDAQTARAWSIGIERVDSPKLAPFWLDAPARMYSSVAARPHATEFES